MSAYGAVSVIILDRAQTLDRLMQVDIVELVTKALLMQANNAVTLPPESYLGWVNTVGEPARSIGMHAHINSHRPVVGVKIINSNPMNPRRGAPRASGVTMILDERSGAIEAVMAAEDISAARTAAVSTVSVERCRRADAETLALIGCGPIGEWHLRLLTRHHSYERVLLFDLVRARAQGLARQATALAAHVEVGTSAEEVVRAGDVVVTATTVSSPYVEWRWLRPGATVVNVSLDDLTEEVILTCDRLIVDDWSLIATDEHRLLGHLARAGLVVGPGQQSHASARVVDGTIAELISGRICGRSAADDVVVVNPFGMAVTDIVIAAAILEALRESVATSERAPEAPSNP